MTVREFTSRVWYGQEIVIIKWADFDKIFREDCAIPGTEQTALERIREKALMTGANHDLRSVTYESVNNMIVDSYGVYENLLIIEVH